MSDCGVGEIFFNFIMEIELRSYAGVDVRRVSFGLTPRKNPMLASFWELYFSIFRNAKFARSVSIIPPDEVYLDPYLICERFNSDSSVKDM